MKKKLRELSALVMSVVFLTASTLGFTPMFQPRPLDPIDVLNAFPETGAIPLPDGEPVVRNETGSGLNTTTFDTLVGTVTVNLPDDVSAGDTISGTVVSEAVWKTDSDGAKNTDELNGYVVEVAKQPAPSQKQGGNLIDFCKDPEPKPDDHSQTLCKKWSVPDGVAKIPIVLKNKKGEVIAKTEVPVNPKANSSKGQTPSVSEANRAPSVSEAKQAPSVSEAKQAPSVSEVLGNLDTKYSTPALGQAGRPLAIKGPTDGDFANASVKLGNLSAKFLASSPRKFVVLNPASAKGLADVEFKFNGRTVAKCTYRSIGVKLSAGKLNLTKGEQTKLTATLSGLVGLLSPVSFQLSNRSPGTVSMGGGDSQTVKIDPSEVNGDTYTAERMLTGVQAGGFSINALVDPYSVASLCTNETPPNIPPVPVPQTSPDNPFPRPLLDSDGNPISNDGPGRPPAPLTARYRVTLNGFTVNHMTNHGVLGWSDAVTFHPDVSIVSVDGRTFPHIHGTTTNSIGVTPQNVNRGGTASANGGLQTGDGYPTQTSPWHRTGPLTPFAPGTIPPTIYFENNIVQNNTAAVIVPDIWSIDGSTDLNLRENYLTELERSRPALSAAVGSVIAHPRRLELANYLVPGGAVGIGNTMTLPFGRPQDRPVGVQSVGNQYGFTPQVLVLTYESADYLSRNSFGFGTGIVPVRYVDAHGFDGDYTLYFLIERVNPTAACAADITGAHFTGHAVLTTTRTEAAGPFPSDINLGIDFVECRGHIRITNFPPISSTFDTALGSNTSTVTMTADGEGSYSAADGRISIPVTLGLVNSLRVLGNSTIPITLSGVRDVSTGIINLRGTGTFANGSLGGFQGTIIITDGHFSQSP